MTNSDRNDELCGILQDYAAMQPIFDAARRAIDAGVWSEAWTRLQHAGRYCEQRQAAEIELLFNNDQSEAGPCERCGFWNLESWCLTDDCEQLEADRRAEIEADRKLGDWDADDLRAGEPSRA